MIPVVSPAEMGAADARTIAAGTPEAELMRRAGRAVAWRTRAVLGGAYGRRVAVLCGQGNNGGDGRVAAGALAAWGVHVDALDASVCDEPARRAIARADAVVDAMFGTGFRGGLDGAAADLARAANESDAIVVAVDIPSGVDGATGAVPSTAVVADHTVTFAAPKPGLWFHPGRALAGAVTVADIGIDLGEDPRRVAVVEADDVLAWVPPRPVTTHKWRSGVLVVGGSAGMTGAPMLAARAAAHLGAGIVWAALPGDGAVRASGTEIITVEVADDDGALAPDAVDDIVTRSERFGAVVLGPGLGRHDATTEAVRALVARIPVPLVVDADALIALGEDRAPLRARAAPTVLTPHDGEFARLTGAPPAPDRIESARSLARDTGAVLLLKGPTTVVAAPDDRVRLNPTGGPDLATAGSGDVLGGMIAAFCARGVNPPEAAAAAAFVHGRAADRAGHTGLVAGDLPALASAALRQLD